MTADLVARLRRVEGTTSWIERLCGEAADAIDAWEMAETTRTNQAVDYAARLAAAERVIGVATLLDGAEAMESPFKWRHIKLRDAIADYRKAYSEQRPPAQKAIGFGEYVESLGDLPDLNSVGLARELCHGCWKTGSDTHWANVPWHQACVSAKQEGE